MHAAHSNAISAFDPYKTEGLDGTDNIDTALGLMDLDEYPFAFRESRTCRGFVRQHLIFGALDVNFAERD